MALCADPILRQSDGLRSLCLCQPVRMIRAVRPDMALMPSDVSDGKRARRSIVRAAPIATLPSVHCLPAFRSFGLCLSVIRCQTLCSGILCCQSLHPLAGGALRLSQTTARQLDTLRCQ